MRVVVTGGSGFIGRNLVAALRKRGDTPVVFSRDPQRAQAVVGREVECVAWQSGRPGESDVWRAELERADAVVNLAGEPVEKKRWDPEFKRLLRESRVAATDELVAAMRDAPRRPRVLLSGSATHYYGRTEAPVDEESPKGSGFVADLMSDWERAARRASDDAIRVVLLRIGWVLLDRGGGMEEQFKPFLLYLGGPMGGDQFIPWIHVGDMVGIVLKALDDEQLVGPINCCAPQPVRMDEFAREVGRALNRPSWLRIPPRVLRALLGEVADIILDGANARPSAVLRAGYNFRYDQLPAALASLRHGASR